MAVDVNQLELPKASPSAARALEIVTGPEPDLRALAQAVMQDPILASTLLRYANSPLYRRAREIGNVPTALRVLGLKSVHSAIVSATMRALLPGDDTVSRDILEHLTQTAVLCRLIARRCCAEAADDLEFLGLIHDVGMLVLAANFREPYARVLADAVGRGVPVDRLETEAFGLSHDPVGARVAREFRLPAHHVEIVATFHGRAALAAADEAGARDVAVLALAHRLLEGAAEPVPMPPETLPESAADLQRLLGLTAEDVDAIREERRAQGPFTHFPRDSSPP